MGKTKKAMVPGFRAAAVEAGVRYRDRLDLGLIVADQAGPAVGVFTTNRVKAPSVLLSKKRLKNKRAQAILVNSGNANACVGECGLADAIGSTDAVAGELGIPSAQVLMSSTGVIGEPLPSDVITRAIPDLVARLRPDGLPQFARAIMTTDVKPKLATREVTIGGGRATIAAVGKGAGMIMPNMATMLVYLLTDVEVTGSELKLLLDPAVEDSFNALTIDGDTSTSDAVIMMASGASGLKPAGSAKAWRAFSEALADLCLQLAEEIAADGEGATKMYRVRVTGATSKAEGDKVARRVANSLLVKTAFHAADPNWGRVMMAVGSAGVKLNPDLVAVSFASARGREVEVVKNGAIAPRYSEPRAQKILAATGFDVRIDLGRGAAERTILTCDLSADYVKINAEYRT